MHLSSRAALKWVLDAWTGARQCFEINGGAQDPICVTFPTPPGCHCQCQCYFHSQKWSDETNWETIIAQTIWIQGQGSQTSLSWFWAAFELVVAWARPKSWNLKPTLVSWWMELTGLELTCSVRSWLDWLLGAASTHWAAAAAVTQPQQGKLPSSFFFSHRVPESVKLRNSNW